MRALTVRQPWAWAIVHGGKDVENRTRSVVGSYRGQVAIHAGLIEDDAAYEDDMIRQALGECADSWYLLERMAAGAFIGIVDLVSVHHHSDHGPHRCSPWGQRDAWHLMLANPRPLEVPIPARGMLGLWTPTAEVLEQLQAVIR